MYVVMITLVWPLRGQIRVVVWSLRERIRVEMGESPAERLIHRSHF